MMSCKESSFIQLMPSPGSDPIVLPLSGLVRVAMTDRPFPSLEMTQTIRSKLIKFKPYILHIVARKDRGRLTSEGKRGSWAKATWGIGLLRPFCHGPRDTIRF
jgi:hypothetical protein